MNNINHLYKIQKLFTPGIILIVLLFCFSELNAQTIHHQKYSKIRLCFTGDFTYHDYLELRIALENSEYDKDCLILTVNSKELSLIMQHKADIELLIDDLELFYAERLKNEKFDANQLLEENFTTGSMGGAYTPEEIDLVFADMAAKFPQYAVKNEIIGYSAENRPIRAYCFGDCTEGSDSPELLYTAVHHAREVIGPLMLSYFLWNLMERAEQGLHEEEFLLNNRSLYVIPLLNPDGYAYNYEIFPNGGGMWRKNRRMINDSVWGVDINRNYGPYKYWNSENLGSSTDPEIQDYRGPFPFSEPETMSMRDFCLNHKFNIALNYHSFGDYLIYPYSAVDMQTPDSMFFRQNSVQMTKKNRYSFGRDDETLGYNARGVSDDWLYFDSLKHRTFSVTPEIGNSNDGFWPTRVRTFELIKSNYPMNLEWMWSAGVNIKPVETKLRYESNQRKSFVDIDFKNIGVLDLDEQVGGIKTNSINTLSIRSLNESVIIPDTLRFLHPLKSMEKQLESFEVEIPKNNFTNGDIVPFEICVQYNGAYRLDTVTLQLYYYEYEMLYDKGKYTSKWDMGDWGTQFDESLNEFILADSPQKLYADNADNYLTLKNPILVKDDDVTVEFTTKWHIEWKYDYAVVQLSTNNGADWKYVTCSRMKPATGLERGRQWGGTYGYAGNYTEWITQEIPLSDYKNKEVLIRFGMLSDFAKHFDGWFLRDIKVRRYPDLDYLSVENIADQAAVVYPNPAFSGQTVTAVLPEQFSAREVDIRIVNTLGSTVMRSRKFSGNNAVLSFNSDFPPGMYVIYISSGTENFAIKLAVKGS